MTRPNRCTLLLVDDSAEDRAVYRRHLEQNRECLYRIVEAETGEQALKTAAERRPDCILLDYRLPDADGLAVLTALTRQSVEDPYAIVMLTGAGEVTVAVQALKGGALDYLDKNNVSADQLHRSIQYAMGHTALRRELNNQRLWSRALLRSISEAVIAGDANGRISFMNGAAETLTGWPAEMAVGQAIDKVYNVVNQDTRQPVNLAHAPGRQASTLDQPLLFVGRGGREIPVDHSYAPITAAKGEFIGSVIVARDVTRRRQSEANLRQREERYALAMRATGDAVWDWELATNELWCNESFEARFGEAGDRPDGRPVALMHEDDRPRVLAQTRAALARRDQGWTCHYRFRRADGNFVNVFERAYIVRAADGQPLRVVAAILDVDDCKAPDSLNHGAVELESISTLAQELRDAVELARVAGRGGHSIERTLGYVTLLADRLVRHMSHHTAIALSDSATGDSSTGDGAVPPNEPSGASSPRHAERDGAS